MIFSIITPIITTISLSLTPINSEISNSPKVKGITTESTEQVSPETENLTIEETSEKYKDVILEEINEKDFSLIVRIL